MIDWMEAGEAGEAGKPNLFTYGALDDKTLRVFK